MKNTINGNIRKAFTLAEILITLVIIGIIGALTVPSLIQRTQKQEYVTALKKAYSVLSNATNRIISEEGSPKGDEGWAESSQAVYNLYKKYLNSAKECGTNKGCFVQNNYKYLSGGYNNNWDGYGNSLILADGMQISFSSIKSECSSNIIAGFEGYCGIIAVDINGEKKPNQYGRDFFYFTLMENGLFPFGCSYDNYCTDNDGGRGCACKVLREGAINY